MTLMPSPTPPISINARFVWSHPAHCIALGFGSGLSPKAPGTVGTLWAWLSWLLLQNVLSSAQLGAVIVLATLVGWWAAQVTTQQLGIADPSAIVWDEVVAFWLVLWLLMPTSFSVQVLAFVLFRFFDAVKPPPVGWADQVFKGFGWRGAWGIYFDDFVAAFCTLLVLSIGLRLFS
jgi:phosphatidylglycerophosphatase A